MTRYTSVVASAASQYVAWIERFVASQPNRFVRGLCQRAVGRMHEDFPELRVAKGFVHWAIPSREITDQHWWLVTADGIIVDPTAEQFASSVCKIRYEELDLTNPEDVARIPIGMCMGCGGPTYQHSYASEVCSETCANDVLRSFA